MSDEKLQRQCDLYRRLLDLDSQKELDRLLREALALIVDVTGARLGYLELHDDETGGHSRWSAAYGMSPAEIADAQSVTSRGIVAEALATGETIVTPSALLDTRFHALPSVQRSQIEAVLCAPIGTEAPLGVLYIQGAPGGRRFSADDCETAELFVRHLAPLADRLLSRESRDPDPTKKFRELLRIDDIIGKSPALADLLHQVALVAPLDVSVLLTGESGTGKSQIARVIHDNGPRARQPFIELNCAALPEALVESELFGAHAGAHSTATRKVDGKVSAADGGTLFLDEVGDLALPAQAKLLQLLQSKEYYPLGATKAVQANVRIVAATNIDLEFAVGERRFRQDLLYRLRVLPVHVPTLAQRREDIGLIADFFSREASRRHRLGTLELSRHTLRAIEATEWPGNVRQLANAVEAAVIRAAGEHAKRVEPRHLFSGPGSASIPDVLTYQEATRRFQAQFLRDTLDEADWNILEVAERLDLARSHVYNLIKSFGVERS